MADLNDIVVERYQIQARLNRLKQSVDSIDRQVNNGATFTEIRAEYNAAFSSSEALLAGIDRTIRQTQSILGGVTLDGSPTQKDKLLSQLNALRQETLQEQGTLRFLKEIADANELRKQQTEDVTRNSAGEEVNREQDANNDGARLQNPPAGRVVLENGNVGPAISPVGTNATRPSLQGDDVGGSPTSNVGGNDATRTARQTQDGEVALNDDATNLLSRTVGIAAGSDRPPIPPEFTNVIIPTENKLAKLASTSYSVSIYLMNLEDYKKLLADQRKVLPSQQLIMQSGGAPVGKRNRWFDVDFYLDDLYIQSLIGTQGTGSPHNAVDMRFTVIEPQGITFLNRLNNAIKEYTGISDVPVSELSQNYLMVIRFYGYDDKGNLISSQQLGFNEVGSDPNSLIEKFIPFQIGDITYKISSKATEYNVTATIPNTSVAFSQARASIPFNMQLVADTVQKLLNGNLVLSSQVGDEIDELNGNGNGDTLTVVQGLTEALNRHQRLLADKNGYEHPDVYEIELDPALANAKLNKPGRQVKNRAPFITTNDASKQLLERIASYDTDTKTYSVQAGTQIVQLIDLVMRNSTYVTSQQTIAFDEKTGKPIKQNPVEVVQWYRIRTQVVPDAYDAKRREYAYRIRYVITPYQINTPRSQYFPPAAYRGVHKLYNYWFTGQNSEVLDFEINVNANYYTTIGNDYQFENTSSGRWFEKRFYASRPGASGQGGQGESTVPSSNLAERLYSDTDVAGAELTILGDPDWLQQSEVFYNKDITLSPFMPDGSVNYDGSEILYELRFNPVVDYNLSNGLTEVYQNNLAQSLITGENNLPQESIVWAAAVVHNYFKEGKFTQKIIGTIRDFAGAIDKSLTVQGVATQSPRFTDIDQTIVQIDQQVAEEASTGVSSAVGPTDLRPPPVSTPGTPKPQQERRVQSNGVTTNANIDRSQPFRDVTLLGVPTRVYGPEEYLLRFYGAQAAPPKPGAGENAVDSDAGDQIWT